MLREDGTVYFDVQPSRPIIERILEWGTVLLWFVAFGVFFAAILGFIG